jgi:hypothetical protein
MFKGPTKGNSRYTLDRRPIIVQPALAALGTPRATYTGSQTELTLFEHESAVAVTMNDFSADDDQPGRLTVRTDRPVKKVWSTLRGELAWQRVGNDIVVEVPVPAPVDVVVLE